MNPETKKKILIVEDDRSLLLALVEKFDREGFMVSSANNGIEGFSSALANHPDVILLDVLMPEMDGFTMLEKLRKTDEWGKKVQVIFLTNITPASEKVMAQITQSEPAFYLVKSEHMLSDVVEKVHECMAANERAVS